MYNSERVEPSLFVKSAWTFLSGELLIGIVAERGMPDSNDKRISRLFHLFPQCQYRSSLYVAVVLITFGLTRYTHEQNIIIPRTPTRFPSQNTTPGRLIFNIRRNNIHTHMYIYILYAHRCHAGIGCISLFLSILRLYESNPITHLTYSVMCSKTKIVFILIVLECIHIR